MKDLRNRWILLVLSVAALFVFSWFALAQSKGIERKEWEYKAVVDVYDDKDKLNKLGAEGWELVATSNYVGNGGSTSSSTLYFKRPK